MYTRIIALNISCFMISAGLLSAAHAAQIDGKLQVKVNIGSACELKSGDNSVLDFGNLTNLNDKAHEQQTAAGSGIELQCGKGIAFKVGLDAGQNPKSPGNVFLRRMKSGSEYIDYQLYLQPNGYQQWGLEEKGGAFVWSGTGDGTIQKHVVYGAILKQATPSSGSYNDIVTVVTTF
ncbi:spore coat U domain-containing protein [Brucella intermedia]|nr:spore coat U domain-containing protein [Brucella intermedia]